MPEILIRTLWATMIVGAGAGLYWLVNRVIIARARDKQLGLESVRPGVPAILYFTAPGCMPCKTVQRPALQQLQYHLDDALQVIEVDATTRPDLANYWGVLSVPTTFIIDAKGRPRRANHGVLRVDKLLRQIEEIEKNQ